MTPPPRIALVTCSQVPEGTDDDAPLRAALPGSATVVWDDDGVDWDAFDLVVVRSTWDYIVRDAEFRAWARSVPRLVNSADVLAWNTDKAYLADAQAAGLPIIPTTFVAPGEAFAAPDGGRPYVVKPNVSVGARDTLRAQPGARDAARAAALVGELHAVGRTALVQPHVASVDERGETGLYFYAGRFSHAIGKGAVLEPGAAVARDLTLALNQRVWAREPSAAERDVAGRAVRWLAERFRAVPPYARIDLVLGDDGAPQILELELTEPSMWFAYADAGAPQRFAAVLQRLAAARRAAAA
ncbi:MAG TPA: hypothetical protein VLB47_06450 [Solirubrobacteraceae bacterium]|nr:hypothetical protein [Solirubrobacteraceae bacterium]